MSAQAATSILNAPSVSMATEHAPATSRLALLDATRLFAAAGIVWVHASTSLAGNVLYPLGTFGVPFYIFVAVLFMARGLTRHPRQSLGHYFVSRVCRVYIPFLAWTIVYVLLNESKSLLIDHTISRQPWSILYAGGHQHLWFLPFLMLVTMIGALLVRGLEHRDRLRKIVIALLIATGAVCAFLPEPAWVAGREPFGDLEFWRFALRAAPSACWALGLGLACAIRGTLPRAHSRMAIGGAVLFAAALLAQPWFAKIELIPNLDFTKPLRALAGLGILLVALWPVVVPALERLGRLGRYSYGVYLSHVVFVRIVVIWMQHDQAQPSIWLDAATFIFALAGSLGLSILLAKSRYTRWALGE